MKAINYRLEYNQAQGMFHFESVTKNNKNTNGWVSICDKLDETQCIDFAQEMERKYGSNKSYPTNTIIKLNFVWYIKNLLFLCPSNQLN